MRDSMKSQISRETFEVLQLAAAIKENAGNIGLEVALSDVLQAMTVTMEETNYYRLKEIEDVLRYRQ